MSPRALVTGATGFVGSHLVARLLADGWDIHAIAVQESRDLPAFAHPEDVTVHVVDGTTESVLSAVAGAKPDVVFHLASLFLADHGPDDIERLIASNVLFGTQVLEGMYAADCTRFVNTSTSWQHFEDADYDPVCLYAATKQAFEAIVDFYVSARGFSVVTLELFDTYGANDPRPKLFHLLDRVSRDDSTLDMSAGEQQLDLVYIDDVVSAFVGAGEMTARDAKGAQERFVVSSGRHISLRDLVGAYARTTGRDVHVNWGARPYRAREVMVPWTSGRPLPGWEPKVSLERGIQLIEIAKSSESGSEVVS